MKHRRGRASACYWSGSGRLFFGVWRWTIARMSESKAPAYAPVASAFCLAGILLLQVAGFVHQPRWEYEVVNIGDAEWDSRAKVLGLAGWDIVTARRASGADGVVSYECIVKRRAQ